MNVAAIALVVSASALLAAPGGRALTREVERYLRPVVASADFNGVVLIARGDAVLVRRAYGRADWDLGVPLTPESRFRIASITKTFTGAAAVMLAERGRLSLDDAVSKFIPGFPNGDRIRVRHLLLHASGVSNPDSPPCGGAGLEDLVAELARKPLDFEPGTQGRYSNGGYVLLARIIEAASGRRWSDDLREEIFGPLKLGATSIDREGIVVENLARGFVPGPGAAGVEHATCEGAWAAIGGGAAISSAGDLHRWGRAVRNETLFRRSALEHPYGWGVRSYHDRSVIEQSGIINGYSSYLAVYLDEDLYIVILANLQTGILTDMGKGLAALALGRRPEALAASPAAVSWTASEKARWIGRFANESIAAIELSDRGEGVYLRWGDSKDLVYLASTGPGRANDRQDAIALELAAGGDAITMRWSSGEPREFRRLPPVKDPG